MQPSQVCPLLVGDLELKALTIACDMPWWRSVVSIQHDDLLFIIKKHKNIRFSEVTITIENLVESIVKRTLISLFQAPDHFCCSSHVKSCRFFSNHIHGYGRSTVCSVHMDECEDSSFVYSSNSETSYSTGS